MGLFYPDDTCCLTCQENGSDILCAACREKLESSRITAPVCRHCGYPSPEGECPFCAKHRLEYASRSVWAHRDTARLTVHQLKFRRVSAASDILADGLIETAQEMSLFAGTVVTWATMPRRRLRERGIDHGYELARRTADGIGLECRQLLIRRDGRHEHTQNGLDAEQRLKNLEGAFSCPEMHGEDVLLIDDVLTTGRTAAVCADVLMKAGCSRVQILTATRAVGHDYED